MGYETQNLEQTLAGYDAHKAREFDSLLQREASLSKEVGSLRVENESLKHESKALKDLQKEGVEMSIGVHKARIEELEEQVKVFQVSLKHAESEAVSSERKAATAQEEKQRLQTMGYGGAPWLQEEGGLPRDKKRIPAFMVKRDNHGMRIRSSRCNLPESFLKQLVGMQYIKMFRDRLRSHTARLRFLIATWRQRKVVNQMRQEKLQAQRTAFLKDELLEDAKARNGELEDEVYNAQRLLRHERQRGSDHTDGSYHEVQRLQRELTAERCLDCMSFCFFWIVLVCVFVLSLGPRGGSLNFE